MRIQVGMAKLCGYCEHVVMQRDEHYHVDYPGRIFCSALCIEVKRRS